MAPSEDIAHPPATATAGAPAAPPQPPPEKASAIWTRRRVILAFWAVVVALGLPLWLGTTSITRETLPEGEMGWWSEGKACPIRYPLFVRVMGGGEGVGELGGLAREVAGLLEQRESRFFDFGVTADGEEGMGGEGVGSAVQHTDPLGEGYRSPALVVEVKADAQVAATEVKLQSWAPVLEVRHRLGDTAGLAARVADEVRAVFQDERASMAYLLEGTPYDESKGRYGIMPEARASLDARTTRAFKHASTYHLTFSLFTAGATPSAWEIDQALGETISPLLDRMSSISHFTVDTQVQLYAAFSPSISGPTYDNSTSTWTLPQSDLSSFINAAEWPLSPGIGAGPTLNFVLYIPSPDQTPLTIASTTSTAYLLPQWGGVQILNPPLPHPANLSTTTLHPAMLTFADQLTSLLGLPPTPPSLALRLNALTRDRTTSLLLSASSTLGALARLTRKLPSIAIPPAVAASVHATTSHLETACSALHEGRFETALDHARIAEAEAEKAFFEPSMVAQVYFPDEHKVAVYVPLLGPMAVPLLMAALKELKRLKSGKAKAS